MIKERPLITTQKAAPTKAKSTKKFAHGVEGDTVLVVLSEEEVKEANAAAKELAEYWLARSAKKVR